MNSWKWTRRLRATGDRREEQIHQHGLAAADIAEDVEALDRRRLSRAGPNSQPSDDDLRARRCWASRCSSASSLATTASWALSRSILPAATRAAYCTEMEADMRGWRDMGWIRNGSGPAPPLASRTLGQAALQTHARSHGRGGALQRARRRLYTRRRAARGIRAVNLWCIAVEKTVDQTRKTTLIRRHTVFRTRSHALSAEPFSRRAIKGSYCVAI